MLNPTTFSASASRRRANSTRPFAALALFACVVAGPSVRADDPPPVSVELRMDRPIVHVDPRDDMLAPEATTGRRAYVRIRVEGSRTAPTTATPVNIALVIDRIAQTDAAIDDATGLAIRDLLGSLNSNDIAAVVGYSDVVEVLWAAGPPRNDLALAGRLRPALPHDAALPVQTATPRANVFGGVAKAAAELRRFTGPARVNHIIVLAAHAPGLGPHRPRDLAQLGVALAREDIGITVVDATPRSDAALRALADGAAGAHRGAPDPARVRLVLNETMARLRGTRARDVRLEMAFHDGVRPIRIIGNTGEVMRDELSASFGDLRPSGAFEIIAQLDTTRCTVGTRGVAEADLRYFDVQLLREVAARTSLTLTCSPGEPHESHFDYDVVSSVALALGEEARERVRSVAANTTRDTVRTLLRQTIDELRETANAIKHPEILSLIDELEAELGTLDIEPSKD